MNEDLTLYKEQVRNLELANVQLTSKMSNFQDKKAALIKLAEINELDKTNLNKSFRKKFVIYKKSSKTEFTTLSL